MNSVYGWRKVSGNISGTCFHPSRPRSPTENTQIVSDIFSPCLDQPRQNVVGGVAAGGDAESAIDEHDREEHRPPESETESGTIGTARRRARRDGRRRTAGCLGPRPRIMLTRGAGARRGGTPRPPATAGSAETAVPRRFPPRGIPMASLDRSRRCSVGDDRSFGANEITRRQTPSSSDSTAMAEMMPPESCHGCARQVVPAQQDAHHQDAAAESAVRNPAGRAAAA